MNLAQLFTGSSPNVAASGKSNVGETGGARAQYARTAEVNRHIHSLTPGQTISGEVISRSGGEVQIRLAEDMVMNARVDQSIHLEEGKILTFEVKSNGSSLNLSPLFTNIAADVNVLKALDMAGLPVNERSVAMTEQLMKAGLPVGRNFLQQVYREVNSFPQGEISDVVNLHKLQLPVNTANMQQMENYRNLNYQLIKGMTSILDALPEAVDNMLEQGDVGGAAELMRQVFSMLEEAEAAGAEQGMASPSELPDTGQEAVQDQAPSQEAAQPQETVQGQVSGALQGIDEKALGENSPAEAKAVPETAEELMALIRREPGMEAELREALQSAPKSAEELIAVLKDGTKTAEQVKHVLQEKPELAMRLSALLQEEPELQEAGGKTPSSGAALADKILQAMRDVPLKPEERAAVREMASRLENGDLSAGGFLKEAEKLLDTVVKNEGGAKAFHRLFADKDFQNSLFSRLKEQWTLKPEEVARPGKVEELYQRIERQLKGLTRALETGGQSGSTAFKAVSGMAQNVDFLHQINQMYTYVQLPLRFQQSDAHGDLYVYTNKKNLANRDGKISALLHLDMEHLGPVDVYVMLESSKVSTKFYVADEKVLDLIEAHLDILTERLKKRGYDCSASSVLRGEEKEDDGGNAGGLNALLQQDSGIVLSQYAFDVRT